MTTAALFPETQRAAMNSLTDQERGDLVLSCENLCKALARTAACASGLISEIDDLRQEALLACCEAAKRWSPDAGTKFSTFATTVIKRHLQDAVDKARPVAASVRPEWERVADDPERSESDAEEYDPDDADMALLSRLDQRSAQVVFLVVFRGTSPDRVATQLGMETKDVKLALRNAARTLDREKAWLEKPGLFQLVGGDS